MDDAQRWQRTQLPIKQAIGERKTARSAPEQQGYRPNRTTPSARAPSVFVEQAAKQATKTTGSACPTRASGAGLGTGSSAQAAKQASAATQ